LAARQYCKIALFFNVCQGASANLKSLQFQGFWPEHRPILCTRKMALRSAAARPDYATPGSCAGDFRERTPG
jgi:hypothetical protein